MWISFSYLHIYIFWQTADWLSLFPLTNHYRSCTDFFTRKWKYHCISSFSVLKYTHRHFSTKNLHTANNSNLFCVSLFIRRCVNIYILPYMTRVTAHFHRIVKLTNSPTSLSCICMFTLYYHYFDIQIIILCVCSFEEKELLSIERNVT